MREKQIVSNRGFFEDRFILEEGAYRAYVTDEKISID